MFIWREPRIFLFVNLFLFSTTSLSQDFSAEQAKAEMQPKFRAEAWVQIWEAYVKTEFLGLKSIELNEDVGRAWSKVKFSHPWPLLTKDGFIDIYAGYNFNEYDCKNNLIANRIIIPVGRNDDYQTPVVSNSPKIEPVASGSDKERLLVAVCKYGKTGMFPDIDAEIISRNGRKAFENFTKQN